MQQTLFVEPSSDLCLNIILSLNSVGSSFDLVAWFLLWYAWSAVKPHIDRCVPFQIMSNQWNWPHNWPGGTWAEILDFSFSFLLKLQTFLKKYVSALSLLCIDCRLMRKTIYLDHSNIRLQHNKMWKSEWGLSTFWMHEIMRGAKDKVTGQDYFNFLLYNERCQPFPISSLCYPSQKWKTSQEMNRVLIVQCTWLWYLNILYWKEDKLKYIFGSINFRQSFIWVGWAVALCQIWLLTVCNPSGPQPGGGNIVQPHGVYISCLLRVNKPFSSEEKRECADLLRNTKVHPCLFRISTAGSKNLSRVLVC